MKHLFIFVFVFTALTSLGFASDNNDEVGESATDCAMMRESNERNNPKENLGSQQAKVRTKSSAVTAQ